MGLEDFIRLSRAQKAQVLQQDGVAIYREEEESFLARVRGFEKIGWLDGYLIPQYWAHTNLHHLPDIALDILKQTEKAYVSFAPLYAYDSARISFPGRYESFNLPHVRCCNLNLDKLQPLTFDAGPSARALRKAGRAITADYAPPKLAIIKEVYRGGIFSSMHFVSSILYEIPRGMPERDLAKVPVSNLKYSTTCICVKRYLRLINAA